MQPAVADVNQVIAIFRKYNFASFSPSPQLRTAVAWQSFMRKFSFGQEFQHHDIGPQLQLDYPVLSNHCADTCQCQRPMRYVPGRGCWV